MKVICHYRNDPERGLTNPLPEIGGRRFIFRLYSGNIFSPIFGTLFGEHWFEPPFPKYIWNAFCKYPLLPFIAWRWPGTTRGGYLGFKLFGVDPEVYKQWIDPKEVYQGSQAVCLTVRPFANLMKG